MQLSEEKSLSLSRATNTMILNEEKSKISKKEIFLIPLERVIVIRQ